MSALRPGTDPENLTPDQFRTATRVANEVERYRAFRADMNRLDSAVCEETIDAPPDDERADAAAPCTCACATKRGPDGTLQASGDCSCTRVAGVRTDENGDPKAVVETCTPNREAPDMTNTDAVDTLPDLVSEARAKRDAEAASAWRSDAKATRGKAPGPNRGRYDAAARNLAVRLGDSSIKRGDAKRVYRALANPNADLSAVAPDTLRSLILDGRKRRDAKRAAAASVAGRRAFGDAKVGDKEGRSLRAVDPAAEDSTAKGTRTDANDHGPLDIEAERQARDVRNAHAWKTPLRVADVGPLRPRTDATDEGGDDPVSLARARRDAATRDAWKPGAA